jgi:hypothetical protein
MEIHDDQAAKASSGQEETKASGGELHLDVGCLTLLG